MNDSLVKECKKEQEMYHQELNLKIDNIKNEIIKDLFNSSALFNNLRNDEDTSNNCLLLKY